MNKLYLFMFVILQSAFLANCKGCHEAPPPTSTQEDIVEWPPKIEVDTIVEAKQEIEEQKEPEEKSKASTTAKPALSSRAVRSSSRSNDDDHDNMRGWDPASEDDMDDNGMSRYMENNDEEGWD